MQLINFQKVNFEVLEIINANELELGESGVIQTIELNKNQGKLYELGFIGGVKLKKTNISFDRQSICFTLNNATFALRKKDAQYIKVMRG